MTVSVSTCGGFAVTLESSTTGPENPTCALWSTVSKAEIVTLASHKCQVEIGEGSKPQVYQFSSSV